MIEKILIGTYTKKHSEGIYELLLDTEKKELHGVKLVGRAGNPTYLAQSMDKRVYAINSEYGDGKKVGGLKIFDSGNKPFNEIGTTMAVGTSPAYVAIDEDRQLVYTANYHMGTITVYKIKSDGTLTQVDQVKHSGVGSLPEQIDGSHPHFADLTPDKRLVVCDLGNDTIYIYDVSDNGRLEEKNVFKCVNGFGPRHIIFNPNTGMAYLVGELANKIAVLFYNSYIGSFSLKQVISTIPFNWTEYNGAAAIRISADYKFLYVSNRGYNSIAVFNITVDGMLTLIENIPSGGYYPRDFNLNHDNKFLVVAHQNSNNITLFARDTVTGKLTKIQKEVFVPEGVAILFEY